MFDPTTSIFAGMSQAALQKALSDAQAALIALQTGSKGVSFSYTQGDGRSRSRISRRTSARLPH